MVAHPSSARPAKQVRFQGEPGGYPAPLMLLSRSRQTPLDNYATLRSHGSCVRLLSWSVQSRYVRRRYLRKHTPEALLCLHPFPTELSPARIVDSRSHSPQVSRNSISPAASPANHAVVPLAAPNGVAQPEAAEACAPAVAAAVATAPTAKCSPQPARPVAAKPGFRSAPVAIAPSIVATASATSPSHPAPLRVAVVVVAAVAAAAAGSLRPSVQDPYKKKGAVSAPFFVSGVRGAPMPGRSAAQRATDAAQSGGPC